MGEVLEPIPPELREVIMRELIERDGALLASILLAREPTERQTRQVVDELHEALREEHGPGRAPSQHGLLVERAIAALLRAWPATAA